MSIHKLTAGSGYEYLTRQVAANDLDTKGGVGLASYYTEKGETPGIWVGKGMDGLDGLERGDRVTADHMKGLFGAGVHPLTIERERAYEEAKPSQRPSQKEFAKSNRLGTPFKVYEDDVSEFEIAVARRFHAHNQALGVRRNAAIDSELRSQIRTEIGTSMFVEEYGREPEGARELSAYIAKKSRQKTTAVAGFDLSFSPVKSVSTLWAVAEPSIAARIEEAHHEAVAAALEFIERDALYSRTGANGARQVDVRGIIATAFVHRDSRAGDPDLHTHVAVSNKVETLDGKWLAIDGRVLFKAVVAASETYNTILEKGLTNKLGVMFAERPNADARKRPTREVVGVKQELNGAFSKRREEVVACRNALVVDFQKRHHRPPTPVEMLDLDQRANLDTREKKAEPRTLSEQRAAWASEAEAVLGSQDAITRMVHEALAPTVKAVPTVTEAWLEQAVEAIGQAMEARRSTWQFWHVYAEAQRRIRATDTPASQVEPVSKLLAQRVLDRSTSLARPSDGITEPEPLLRANGESVYRVAHSDLFTSQSVLAAEERLVAAAGRTDGFAVSEEEVGLALLESAANMVELNAGQQTLVREMATSGARLQLAIAPAGSGKTTAMRVLAQAWTGAGGQVLGLAPSAVAASELGSKIADAGVAAADTLAKLLVEIELDSKPFPDAGTRRHTSPDWYRSIGPRTLVVIDEAGMADTVSLDKAVTFLLNRGASVRLIGDDQQLAAIGAGGVLRDIRASHGALQLSELMRFADPAEGSASLALREGRPESLGFYLDRGRVHVGDTAAMTEELFNAWITDRSGGLDAIMLAPTRELVSELNQRARAERIAHAPSEDLAKTVRLGDGNTASVGDLIITRNNDRRLRMTATDWVKNGDRWLIADTVDGAIRAQHLITGRLVTLPADYVSESTDLGYACTVHTAQGVTADTMHGLATGEESRQLLYTLMTRGKLANHVYLSHVASGDPHTVIHPDLLHPKTATDVLEQILARDDSPRSATTLLREAGQPSTQLTTAAAQYTDALYFAAEHLIGTDEVERIESTLEGLVPHLTDAPAWPALRAHLLLLAAEGEDPIEQVRTALEGRGLTNAVDAAAVLDWRLDETGARSTSGAGPLPWMFGVPTRLEQDPTWGDYLTARHQLVVDLATQVRQEAEASSLTPAWLTSGAKIDRALVADVAVWRAASGVLEDDLRPTGPMQAQKLASKYQRQLGNRLRGDHTPAILEWRAYLTDLGHAIGQDGFVQVLAERLATMSRAGLEAHQYVKDAMTSGPLPDDHAAAALWWRISAQVTPAVAARMDEHDHVTTAAWVEELTTHIGAERASALQASTWWPALVSVVDHGLERGWTLPNLLNLDTPLPDDVDEGQALIWRASVAEATPPDPHEEPYWDEAPVDRYEGWNPAFTEPPTTTGQYAQAPLPTATDAVTPAIYDQEPYWDDAPEDRYEGWEPPAEWGLDVTESRPSAVSGDPTSPMWDIDHQLIIKALIRDGRHIDEDQLFTMNDQRRAFTRAHEWDTTTVARQRMVDINEATTRFYQARYTGSWARDYITERLHGDITGHEHYRPGYAPAGWTTLVDHLRGMGFTDDELLVTGVASTASTSRLIDRFRDRAMFPIVNVAGEVIGFSARRHPSLTDADKGGPKYLNTAATPLFQKGAQLYGVIPELLAQGAKPVLVEGPMDAIAVTLASAGRYMGVAPLGTALTEDQAIQLARIFQDHDTDPLVATDGDKAGQKAAERDFWLLAGVGLDPALAIVGEGLDPAQVLEKQGPAALVSALNDATPLGLAVLDRLLARGSEGTPDRDLMFSLLAGSAPSLWTNGAENVAEQVGITELEAKHELLAAITKWDNDPRKTALDQIANTPREAPPADQAPVSLGQDRWRPIAENLDDRLTTERGWPLLVQMLDQLEATGANVEEVLTEIVGERPLGENPVQDLRYRLVGIIGEAAVEGSEPSPRPSHGTPRRPHREHDGPDLPPRPGPRR